MAGASADFPAADFRDAIHAAMAMAQPANVGERITMRWSTQKTFASADPGGHPYSFQATPVSQVVVEDLVLLVAWKFAAALDAENEMGSFDETKIVLTLLDTEWEEMMAHGAGRYPDQILAAGNIYAVTYSAPPEGLFDVTVYTIFAEAPSTGAAT